MNEAKSLATGLLFLHLVLGCYYINVVCISSDLRHLASLNARQVLSQLFKQSRNIHPCLRRDFNVHDIHFLGALLPLFCSHYSLLSQVDFVSDQHNDDITAPLSADILHPLLGVSKALSIGDVIANDGH